MNEDFRLDAGRGGDVADLLEGQLTGQHDAREAHLRECLRPGPVVHRQLRARVQLQLREVAADEVVDAQVLDDERIDADVRDRGEVIDQFAEFILPHQCVDGDENAAPRREAVRVGRDLGKFIEREVLGLGAGREFLQAQVDRVGAVLECREGRFRAARGSQKLNGMTDRLARDEWHTQRHLGQGGVFALGRLGLGCSRRREAMPRRCGLHGFGSKQGQIENSLRHSVTISICQPHTRLARSQVTGSRRLS